MKGKLYHGFTFKAECSLRVAREMSQTTSGVWNFVPFSKSSERISWWVWPHEVCGLSEMAFHAKELVMAGYTIKNDDGDEIEFGSFDSPEKYRVETAQCTREFTSFSDAWNFLHRD